MAERSPDDVHVTINSFVTRDGGFGTLKAWSVKLLWMESGQRVDFEAVMDHEGELTIRKIFHHPAMQISGS